METEALGSEGGERGDWTQSHVKGQRAASPQGAGSTHKGPVGGGLGGGGRGDRGGEATLGTKADSTDTSHPLRVRLSLAPWGTCSLICAELPAPRC